MSKKRHSRKASAATAVPTSGTNANNSSNSNTMMTRANLLFTVMNLLIFYQLLRLTLHSDSLSQRDWGWLLPKGFGNLTRSGSIVNFPTMTGEQQQQQPRFNVRLRSNNAAIENMTPEQMVQLRQILAEDLASRYASQTLNIPGPVTTATAPSMGGLPAGASSNAQQLPAADDDDDDNASLASALASSSPALTIKNHGPDSARTNGSLEYDESGMPIIPAGFQPEKTSLQVISSTGEARNVEVTTLPEGSGSHIYLNGKRQDPDWFEVTTPSGKTKWVATINVKKSREEIEQQVLQQLIAEEEAEAAAATKILSLSSGRDSSDNGTIPYYKSRIDSGSAVWFFGSNCHHGTSYRNRFRDEADECPDDKMFVFSQSPLRQSIFADRKLLHTTVDNGWTFKGNSNDVEEEDDDDDNQGNHESSSSSSPLPPPVVVYSPTQRVLLRPIPTTDQNDTTASS